jgi:predicted methyltransferase MtxX (methanogen marker protein 4)
MHWNERSIGKAMGIDRATVYWSVKKTLENVDTNYMKVREKLPIIQDKITKKRYDNAIREERKAAAVGTSSCECDA